MPDCLLMDLKVPIGISFLGEGTITVFSPFFSNFFVQAHLQNINQAPL